MRLESLISTLSMVKPTTHRVAPFVEKHPLNEINQVFEAVHAGTLKRRAILVPTN